MNNIFKDMIKSKIGIILIIIFFFIGYFYIKSIFLGLLLASIYHKNPCMFICNFIFFKFCFNIFYDN